MFAARSSSVTREPVFPQKTKRTNLSEILLVLVAFVMATVLLTWPLVLHLSTRAAQLGDYLLTTYIQAWVAHALATHPTQILNMNMLYPSRHVLAASENLIGNQLLFAPVYALSGNPILAANVVTFASFLLCGLTMYLLVRTLTGRKSSAAIAGFIYAFSPPRIAQLGHSQLLSMQWMPMAALFLFLFLFRKQWTSLVAFCGFVLLQVLCSLYLGYFALLVCVSYFVAIVVIRRDLFNLRAAAGLFLGTMVVLALLFPLLQPYREMQKEGILPKDSIAFATIASAEPISSYLDNGGGVVAHVYTPLLRKFRSSQYDWEKILFPGLLPIFFTGILIAYCIRLLIHRRRAFLNERLQQLGGETGPSLVLGSILLLLLAYVLSLGPFLWRRGHATRTRLPFFWLSKWVPGLGTFRVPARFGLITSFALAILAGVAIAAILTYLARWQLFQKTWFSAAVTTLVIGAMAIECNSTPFHDFPIMTPSTVAPEYRWLAQQPPDEPVVEWPILFRGPVANPSQQTQYMYASIFHWQPLVNGYTGYEPPKSMELMRVAARLPVPFATQVLAQTGVRYVVVHWSSLSSAQRGPWQHLQPHSGLDLAADFGSSRVYRINASDAVLAATRPIDPALCPSPVDAKLAYALNHSALLLGRNLADAGFENDSLAPWHRFQEVSGNISTVQAHTGTHSLAQTGGDGSFYQNVNNLTRGTTYIITAWVLAAPEATATAQLAIFDPSTSTASFSALNTCAPGWQRLSLSATVGRIPSLTIHLFRNNGSGTIYWDDVAIYRQN